MDIIWIIIAIPIAIVTLVVFSFLFGSAFRQWNEGDRFNEEQSKSSLTKTLLIGLAIFLVIGFILSKCEG
jgi:Na+/H+ antiporter NhaC